VRLSQRVVVVGGGVLGTMHAVAARERGYEVVHLEREAEARGASVRNFGLIWVSGRRAGTELDLALRARELWEKLAADVPGLVFRAAGSLTLATEDSELQVLQEAAALPDAERRGFELLGPGAVRAVNPALRGALAGGLLCRADAIVEPRQALPALRGHLAGDGYEWLPGREVTEIAPTAVRDHTGAWHQCDLVILCTGAAFTGVAGRYLRYLARDGVRRVRLQMMQTAPMAQRLTTAVADGDSLRYYPAYDLPGRRLLPPQPPAAERARAQLLLVQGPMAA
jgi:FAD dependent oxidoreductase TIGR03364